MESTGTPFGIANGKFQIENLRSAIPSTTRTGAWPTRQRAIDRVRKGAGLGQTLFLSAGARRPPICALVRLVGREQFGNFAGCVSRAWHRRPLET